ncbi:hypothetical protein [Nocardia brevicatena]|uniref:hypothetical protein n=1 Tax=Nocardia brevicatena TaxID=37327 RepID=UPI000309AA25|nr:hypothetical protein [Nocardia brevicatena]
MTRTILKVVATGAILFATVYPGTADAEAGSREPVPSAPAETTAPFDPICPLCFVREWIESGFQS